MIKDQWSLPPPGRTLGQTELATLWVHSVDDLKQIDLGIYPGKGSET